MSQLLELKHNDYPETKPIHKMTPNEYIEYCKIIANETIKPSFEDLVKIFRGRNVELIRYFRILGVAREEIIEAIFYAGYNSGLDIEDIFNFIKAIPFHITNDILRKTFLHNNEFKDESYARDILDELKITNPSILNEFAYYCLNNDDIENEFLISYLIGNKILNIEEFESALIKRESILYEDILYYFSDKYKLFHAVAKCNSDMFRFYKNKIEPSQYYVNIFCENSLAELNDNSEETFNEIIVYFNSKQLNVFNCFAKNGKDEECLHILENNLQICNNKELIVAIENCCVCSIELLLKTYIITQNELNSLTLKPHCSNADDFNATLCILSEKGFKIKHLIKNSGEDDDETFEYLQIEYGIKAEE